MGSQHAGADIGGIGGPCPPLKKIKKEEERGKKRGERRGGGGREREIKCPLLKWFKMQIFSKENGHVGVTHMCLTNLGLF